MNSHLETMFSARGKRIVFPKYGIVSQTREAEGKKINATVGTAAYGGEPLFLPALQRLLNLLPKDSLTYASSFGKKQLREFWQKKIYLQNPSLGTTPISLPVVTDGMTHGLNIAAFLFVDPEDVLVTPDLHWENYDLIFRVCYGSRIETFPLFHRERFHTQGMKDAIAKHRRPNRPVFLLLNFPHNPTGYALSEGEVNEIVSGLSDLAESGQDMVVLVDDAYFGLWYEEGLWQGSLFGRLANLHKRILAVKIDGSSKEDFAWGLRVAFLTYGMKGLTSEDLIMLEEKTAALIRATVSSVSHLAQSLLLLMYESPTYQQEKNEKVALLKERYGAFKRVLNEHPEYQEIFYALPCNAGYFVCLQLKAGIDAEAVRKLLLEKYDTGIIADQGFLRITFASVNNDDFPELFTHVYQAGKSLLSNNSRKD